MFDENRVEKLLDDRRKALVARFVKSVASVNIGDHDVGTDDRNRFFPRFLYNHQTSITKHQTSTHQKKEKRGEREENARDETRMPRKRSATTLLFPLQQAR